MAAPNLLPQLNGPPPLTQAILPESPPFDVATPLSAYLLVTAAESEAVQRYGCCQGQPKAVKDAAAHEVLASRVVGFLFPALWNMRHSLGDTPVARLATEVVSAPGNSEIYALGRKYIDHLICSFRTTTVPLRPPSSHPSRPSIDQLEDMLTDAVQGSATDHRSARTRALARDGYHCMITNNVDFGSFYQNEAIKKLRLGTGAAVRVVQTCHILNESSILQNIEPNDEYPQQARPQHVGGALAILKMFGLGDLVERLMTRGPTASASGVHDLLNILSLTTDVHIIFDKLMLALEPVVDKPNTYDVVFADPETAIGFFGLKNQITLTNFVDTRKFRLDGELELPLPDPRLLALHAVCVRVAHMSGAAEALDEFDRDMEETSVLAEDGASAHLLNMIFSSLVSAAA
ncbi:hypothetical protein FB45DRAFT_282536 [Roridomyces roridus]|uniref:HNH nuclease domain-containing protein n=1 Tax=Roridomyces roridus TaxID=1738132 RepID=A0AAD7CAC3_9AGAR|nr:hypothetical protein FB45DRAFT_282536 [Roridomyces roridus]